MIFEKYLDSRENILCLPKREGKEMSNLCRQLFGGIVWCKFVWISQKTVYPQSVYISSFEHVFHH